MKSYKFELYKIITSKALIGFLLVAFTGLVLLYAYQDESRKARFSAYRQLNSELKDKDPEEKLAYIDEKLEQHKSETENSNLYYSVKGHYTEYIYSDITFLNEVKKEINKTLEYKDYLDEIDKTARVGLNSGPFAKKGFSRVNILKTQQAYSKLKDIEVTYTASRGISEMLKFLPRVLIELFGAVFVAVFVLMRERESAFLHLFRSQAGGRGKNLFSRLLAMYSFILMINALIMCLSLIISCIMFGFPARGCLSSPVQSLCDFSTSSLKISVVGCIMLCWLTESLVCMLLATFTVLLSIFIRKSQFLFIILAMVLGIEYYWYSHIDYFSKWVNLKHINIISFLNASGLIGEYTNININGSAINLLSVALISSVAVFVLLFVISIPVYEKLYNEGREMTGKKMKVSLPDFLTCSLSSLQHECYKIFISGKGLIIIAVFAVIMISGYKPAGRKSLSVSESFYRDYVISLEGLSAADASQGVEEIRQKVKSNTGDKYYAERMEAVGELEKYYDYLDENNDCVFVNAEGYERLFADEKRNSINAMIASLVIILLISKLCVYDIECGADRLIKSTRNGTDRTGKNRLVIHIIICCIVFALVYLKYFLSIANGYELNMFGRNAASLMSLSKVPHFITLKAFTALNYIRFFAGLFLIYPLCRIIAGRTKNYSMTVIFTLAIVIIPLILVYIGIPGAGYILYNLLLI